MTLESKIEVARQRLAELDRQAAGGAKHKTALRETIEALSYALEELETASEELRQQNDTIVAGQAALETERRRYRDTFDLAPNGYLLTDEKGVIIEANRTSAILLGFDQGALAGMPILGFAAPDGRALLEQLSAFRKPGFESIHDYEVQLRPQGAAAFPAALTIGAIRDEAGRLTGLRWIVRDITERKQDQAELEEYRRHLEEQVDQRTRELETARAEAVNGKGRLETAMGALSDSEERYKALVESAPDAVIVLQDGRFLFANAVALAMYGAESLEGLQTKTVLDLIHPDERDAIAARMRRGLAGEHLPVHAVRIVRLDGQVTEVEAVSGPVTYDGTRAVQVIFRDITDHRKKEEELRKLNRTLQARSHSNQSLARAADESEYLREICRIVVEDCGHAMVWIGYAEDDEGRTVRPVAWSGIEGGYLDTLHLTWADADRGRGPTGAAIRTGRPTVCRDMLTDPRFAPWRAEAVKRGYQSSVALPLMADGKSLGALTIYSPKPDAFSPEETALLSGLADDLAFGVATIRMRAAHRRAEETLRQNEERFRLIVTNTPDHIIVQDADLRYISVTNPQLGLSEKDMIGKTDYDFLAEAEAARLTEIKRRVIETGLSEQVSVPVVSRAGDMQHFEGSYIPRRNSEGQIDGVIGYFRNVTGRVRMEASLERAKTEAERQAAEMNTILDAMEDLVLIYDSEGRLVRTNAALNRFLGIDLTDLEWERQAEYFRKFAIRHLDGRPMAQDERPVLRALRGETVRESLGIMADPKGHDAMFSATSSPIIVGDQIRGAVTVNHDITALIQAEKELTEHLANERLLAVAATALLEPMPTAELFQFAVQHLRIAAGNAVSTVSRYNPVTNQTIVEGWAGPDEKLAKLKAILERDPVGLAFTVPDGTVARMLRGTLALVEGGLHDLTFGQIPLPLCEQLERELELGAIYAMPFVLEKDFIGTVAVMTGRAEGLKNREVIEALVNQIGLALRRRRAEESLRRTTEREQLLAETTARLLATDNPQAIVNELCRAVMGHLDCQFFFNFLADEPCGRLRLNACAGISDEQAEEIEWLDYGVAVCGCAAQQGRRIVAEDIQHVADPRTDLVKSYGVQAYACHPLMTEGRVIGTLSFGTKTRTAFTPDETELMRQVADKVATAMQRILVRRELEASEERYRSLFNAMTEGFALHEIITDEQGEACDYRFLDINPSFERLTGLKRDAVLGRTVKEVLPQNDPYWVRIYGEVALTGKPIHFEDYSTPLGKWYEVVAYSPAPRQFAAIFMDITGRKQVEEALMRAHAELEQRVHERTTELRLINDVHSLFATKGSRKEYLDGVVRVVRKWSGCANVGIRVTDLQRHIPYESCSGFQPEFLAVEDGLSLDKDTCICVRVIAGQPEATDLAHMTPYGSLHLDNSIAWAKGLTPEQRAQYRGKCMEIGYETVAVIPIRYRTEPVGAIHITDTRPGVLPLAAVELLESLAPLIGEAIKRFDVEDALRRTSLYARSLIEASLDPLVTISPEGKITDVNEATELATGLPRTELIGSSFSDYFTNPQKAEKGYQQVLAEGRVMNYPLTIRHRSGSTTDVLYNASTYWNEAGEAQGVFAAARDITERLRSQEEAQIRLQQLMQADKMVSLGILVSGVAHEINNPNHSIMSNLTLLSEAWEGARPVLDNFYHDFGDFVLGGFEYSEYRDKIPEMFEVLLACSKRIELIVTELRDYARSSPAEKMTATDVNSIVKSANILTANTARKFTERFSINYGAGLPPVLANFQRIEQVVINLFQNACQSLPDRDRGVFVTTSLAPSGKMVLIEVRDEGVGIAEEDMKHLGDPFFTTRRTTGGMGLGLSISINIVREHGGALTFESKKGKGTRAVVSLPVHERSVRKQGFGK